LEIEYLPSLPEGILSAQAQDLYRHISGPTLISIAGQNKNEELFISVLQHGNEDAGWEAIKQTLNKQATLKRNVLLFIGNVEAARYGQRHLDHQPDFNRCWPSHEPVQSPEQKSFLQLTERIRQRPPLFSIDIHNNSGKNPHYSAINRLNPECMSLARLFSDTAMYFKTPAGVQSDAFAQFCPAITIECGLAGTQKGINHCQEFLESCLSIPQLDLSPEFVNDLRIYRTVARTLISPDVEFGFKSNSKPLNFIDNIESLNFTDLKAGTVLAQYSDSRHHAFSAIDESGTDVTDLYLSRRNNQVMVKKPFTPAMLTVNEKVIRQDCLCYIMESVS